MPTTTMNQPIDWLLWWTLHLFFTIFLAIGNTFSSAGRILTSAIFASDSDSGSAAGEGQASGVNGFEEKVKGVAVAVVFENLHGLDWEGKVSQLISWFSAINVSHVTLFDPAGVLKRSQPQLETTLKVLGVTQKDALEVDEQENGNSPQQNSRLLGELSDLRKRKGEYVHGEYCSSTDGECLMIFGGMSKVRSEMKVELLSLHDGKESLVRAAKTMCENAYKLHYAIHHQSKLPKLTEQDVKESLQVNGTEGPDPDLLLLFGKTRSLHGFPPWRLRLTEIVHMGPLQHMSGSSLVAALKEFSKKTHRYGR